MTYISKTEEIPTQILALWQPLLINIQHFQQLCFTLLNQLWIWRDAKKWSKQHMHSQVIGRWVKVMCFNFQPLFHNTPLFWCPPHQLNPLRSVFVCIIPHYSTRFCRNRSNTDNLKGGTSKIRNNNWRIKIWTKKQKYTGVESGTI